MGRSFAGNLCSEGESVVWRFMFLWRDFDAWDDDGQALLLQR